MPFSSTLKRNKLSSHEKTWKKLRCILLGELNQSERLHTYCMKPTIQNCEKGKTVETIKRSVVAKDQRIRGEIIRAHSIFLGQWKYSVWRYNNREVSYKFVQTQGRCSS